jgi:hypothetical protein
VLLIGLGGFKGGSTPATDFTKVTDRQKGTAIWIGQGSYSLEQPCVTFGRDKRPRDGEWRVYRGSIEITFSKKGGESFQRVFIAGQLLNPQETFEHQTFASSPDIGDPHIAPAATGTPH